MNRPIQPGDFVSIQLSNVKQDYQISSIKEDGIYIFPPSNPNLMSKLIFENGQWKVFGTSQPYQISFYSGKSNIPSGWEEVFQGASAELARINNILEQSGPFYPKREDIFRAFYLCPLDQVKVVILGQDPYHTTCNGHPVANGLAFSTTPDCPVPPSLANIYRELQFEYPDFVPPRSGDLSSWAKQGVLLLNTSLTVKPGQPKSHEHLWDGFMRYVFDAITEVHPECIYLLWGKYAQDLSPLLGPLSIKLRASHPSPFSANRATANAPAFLGSGIFREANQYLIQQDKEPIDWIGI